MVSSLGELTQTPMTGDIGIFEVSESFEYNERLVPKGEPAHSGIYILKTKSGEMTFLNRLDAGLSVNIQTTKEINEYFKGRSEKLKEHGINADVSKEPKFYKRKNN